MTIHDSVIVSYTVNLTTQSLDLIVSGENNALSKLHFIEVLTHSFENIMLSNIIFSIDEGSINDFLNQNKQLILEGKSYGWPLLYTHIDELFTLLTTEKYKYYMVYSSLGLSGFVICKDFLVSTL